MCLELFVTLSHLRVISGLGLWFLSLHQMTPLHVAATSARFKVVECLVEQGANISTKDNDEVSIIM